MSNMIRRFRCAAEEVGTGFFQGVKAFVHMVGNNPTATIGTILENFGPAVATTVLTGNPVAGVVVGAAIGMTGQALRHNAPSVMPAPA